MHKLLIVPFLERFISFVFYSSYNQINKSNNPAKNEHTVETHKKKNKNFRIHYFSLTAVP